MWLRVNANERKWSPCSDTVSELQGMDSRIVNREIRREIWPALRARGFNAFTSRTAWRHCADRVWVVNFQSFNSYFSLVDGCTTFSFALNLGIYFHALSEEAKTEAQVKPKNYQCHLHGKLFKSIAQQNYGRKDIWYVDPEGLNLLEVLDDARRVLLVGGMAWFERLSELPQVLEILVHENETDTLFGIGAKWSPHRKLLIGRAAVATGQEELGLRILREADAELESIKLKFESLGRNGRQPKRSTT